MSSDKGRRTGLLAHADLVTDRVHRIALGQGTHRKIIVPPVGESVAVICVRTYQGKKTRVADGAMWALTAGILDPRYEVPLG